VDREKMAEGVVLDFDEESRPVGLSGTVETAAT